MSNNSSVSIPKGKQGNMRESHHSMNGSIQSSSQVSDGSSAPIPEGRHGLYDNSHKKNGILDIQSSDEASYSSSSLMLEGKDKRRDDSSSSIHGDESHSLTSNLSDVSLSDKSGSSNKANARRPKSQAQYQPDKWMVPDKAEDALTQLNLAIVSWISDFSHMLQELLVKFSVMKIKISIGKLHVIYCYRWDMLILGNQHCQVDYYIFWDE